MPLKQLEKTYFEIFALIATVISHFIFKDVLQTKLIFMITASLFWLSFFIFTYKTDRLRFKSWGLSFENFGLTFRELLPFLVFLIILFIVYGYYFKTSILSWKIIPALIIYPVWGVLQQIMVIGLFTFSFMQIFPNTSNLVLILLTAITFSLIHYPSSILMPGTFVMALVYTYLYLRGRNLLVFGIFHGVLGAFFFHCIYQWNSFMQAWLYW